MQLSRLRKWLDLDRKFCERFVCLPDEKLILATRTHWIITAIPLLLIFASTSVSTLLLLLTPLNQHLPPPLILTILLSVLFLALVNAGFIFLSWYFHFYIVTSRKILEVRMLPFLYCNISDVFLDQVRCTEIDIKKDGLVRVLVNMGDIILTFDRPTRQEEFILTNIHDPEAVGLFLGDTIEMLRLESESNPLIWYKDKSPPHHFRITDEISPRVSLL
jgi:hypothetical protein